MNKIFTHYSRAILFHFNFIKNYFHSDSIESPKDNRKLFLSISDIPDFYELSEVMMKLWMIFILFYIS